MKSVLTVSVVLSLALMLGRLSGFVREMLLAARLGVTETADAAVLILTLPDFMVGLLIAGGVNAALIPALKQSAGTDRRALFYRAVAFAGGAFLVLAALMALGPGALAGVMAAELDLAALPDYSAAFRLSLVALPIAALIGVTTAWLNTVGRFVVPGLSVLVFNTGLCIYIAWLLQEDGRLWGFAMAIVVSAGLRLAVQLWPMRRVLTQPAWRMSAPPAGLARRFVQGILGFAVIVAVPILFRSLYAAGGDGLLAQFSYALKLFELPSTLMVAPVVMVLLPKLAAERDTNPARFRYSLETGLTAAIALAGIATAVGLTFMPLIVEIVYQRGEISDEAATGIAQLARILLLALVFYAVVQITAAGLNADLRPGRVLLNTLIALTLAIAAYVGLVVISVPERIATPVAFVAFNAFAAGLGLIALFGTGQTRLAAQLARPVLRLSAGGLALWGLVDLVLPPMSLVLEVVAMVLATALLGGLVRDTLEPLMKLRTDTR